MEEKKYVDENTIYVKFSELNATQRINTLWNALDYMEQYNGRGKIRCLALAMGYRNEEGLPNTYYKP